VAVTLVGAAEKPPTVDAKGAADLPFMHLPALGNPNALNTEIVSLSFERMGVTDLNQLAKMTRLRELTLDHNEVADLKPLAGLKELEQLSLSHNLVVDLKPLAKLVALRDLSIDHNLVTNLQPLEGLTKLEFLQLAGNPLDDLQPLAKLKALKLLNLVQAAGIPVAELARLHLALPQCRIQLPDALWPAVRVEIALYKTTGNWSSQPRHFADAKVYNLQHLAKLPGLSAFAQIKIPRAILVPKSKK
jgi:Leucine-rich repeat (LRR) protein